jgi:hypothetical protein
VDLITDERARLLRGIGARMGAGDDELKLRPESCEVLVSAQLANLFDEGTNPIAASHDAREILVWVSAVLDRAVVQGEAKRERKTRTGEMVCGRVSGPSYNQVITQPEN